MNENEEKIKLHCFNCHKSYSLIIQRKKRKGIKCPKCNGQEAIIIL